MVPGMCPDTGVVCWYCLVVTTAVVNYNGVLRLFVVFLRINIFAMCSVDYDMHIDVCFALLRQEHDSMPSFFFL